MSENIKLNKQVYNKNNYPKIIDTTFKQLGVKTIQEQLDSQPTIEDFFIMYNELFYDIPELGSSNSHEFLIQKSSDYINFDPNQEIIEALQNEITQLRTELLETQKQIINTNTNS